MFISAVAYWGVGVPAAYLLGFHTRLGAPGVWAGLVIGLVAATVLLLWRVKVIHWRNAPTTVAQGHAG
jgi:multidrug resistance protein, MATE family